MTRRILGLLACMAAVLFLTVCTLVGRAVGDTRDSVPEVVHGSTHPTGVTVNFVGSTDTAADEFVINALSDDKLNVYYASLETSTSSADATDGVPSKTESSDAGTASENGADSMDVRTSVGKNTVTVQQGVADFVAHAVKIVVISGIDVTDASRGSWDQALTNAREADIPVALIDPKHAPENELLCAVILHLNTNSADSGDTADTKPMTITDAVLTIMRDELHERKIKVIVSWAESGPWSWESTLNHPWALADYETRRGRLENTSVTTAVEMPEIGATGPTPKEVVQRIENDRSNTVKASTSRSVRDIVRVNIFMLFNDIVFAAMVLVLIIGSWKDAVFGFAIIINTGIGIVTELRVKRTPDRLSILVASEFLVHRGGRDMKAPRNEIVLDDLLWVRTGEQVPASGQITQTWGLELNESVLTGESRTVRHEVGEQVYSSTTVVSGMALVKVNAVDSRSYAATLTAQAKVYKKTISGLNKGINTILKFMAFLVVPLCILPILSQIRTAGGRDTALSTSEWRQAAASAVAGIVGMIPEGLVLLTSLNFAVAAMRLARHNTLVQELESVETLARVDALNLDKASTITDSGIAFSRLVMLDSANAAAEQAATQTLYDCCNEEQPNGTNQAVLAGLKAQGYGAGTVGSRVPFSSARK